MKRIILCVLILMPVASVAIARSSSRKPVQITLYPSAAPKPEQKYTLFLKTEEKTDKDAVTLYEKAAQLLPADTDRNHVREWLRMPLEELPQEQVQKTLDKYAAAMKLIEEALQYKAQSWPQFKQGTLPKNTNEYRDIAFAIALKARLQIAQHKYDQAIDTLRTGLTMSKQLGESPTVMQGMTGMAVAGFMCRQIEQLIQNPDAPNLFEALGELPKPLVDLEKPMSVEMSNLELNQQYNVLVKAALKHQLESAFEAVRVTMNRLDRQVAALRCIEAIRLYTGAHDGKFPEKLSDITEVDIPDDPIAQKPFTYTRTGSKAVLEGEASEGSEGRDEVKYELDLKEK